MSITLCVCPKCHVPNTIDKWNEIGEKHYGNFYPMTIGNSGLSPRFICPECHKESNDNHIRRISGINNKSLTNLLEK